MDRNNAVQILTRVFQSFAYKSRKKKYNTLFVGLFAVIPEIIPLTVREVLLPILMQQDLLAVTVEGEGESGRGRGGRNKISNFAKVSCSFTVQVIILCYSGINKLVFKTHPCKYL